MQLQLDTIVLRLLVACVFGMVLGWEREGKNKPAGLKTHMLVSLGAAAFFLIFVEFALGPLKDAEGITPDPMRVIEGVVTGIGFLGAGAIIQGGRSVVGLTTGAGIWVSGGIGLACGGGYFVLAGVVTFFALVILTIINAIEHRIFGRKASVQDDVRESEDGD